MDWRAEISYLLEIRDVCWQVDEQAARFSMHRKAWLQADAAAAAAQSGHPRDFEREAFDEAVRTMVSLQRQIWEVVESFLTSWARLSLMLFPAPRGKKEERTRAEARGEHLQSLLGVKDGDLLRDRSLRDAWMHFDERLDQAVAEGRHVGRQFFTRTQQGVGRGEWLRIMVLDEARVVIAMSQAYDLDAMFVEVGRLRRAAEGALSSGSERHRGELLADESG